MANRQTYYTEADMTRMAKHKGRAYVCMRCGEQPFIDTKTRFQAHFMKHHTKADELPFFCSLCNFRCTEKKQLTDHVFSYKPHRQMAQQREVVDSSSFFRENPQPYRLLGTDFRVLSQEQSIHIFKQRYQQSQNPPQQSQNPPQQDLLCQALEASIPESVLDSDDLLLPAQDMFPYQSCAPVDLSKKNNSEPQGMSISPLPVSAIQTGRSDPVLGSWLNSSVQPNPVTQTFNLGYLQPQPAHGSIQMQQPAIGGLQMPPPASGSLQIPQVALGSHQMPPPASGSLQIPQVALGSHQMPPSASGSLQMPPPASGSLQMPQVALGSHQMPQPATGTPSQSVAASRTQSPPPANPTPEPTRMIPANPGSENPSVSPIPTGSAAATENIMQQLLGSEEEFFPDFDENPVPATNKSQKRSNSPKPSLQGWLSSSFAQLKDILEAHNKNLTQELEKNSRTVRCLEKSLNEHTKAVNLFTETMKDLNQTLINNAREERRRHDDSKRLGEEIGKQNAKKPRSEDEENQRRASPNVKAGLAKVLQNRANKNV